ncbi:copper transporter [uncultured Arcanobacterium sp.]|uniref:copper transporter n=1 Tax=uncultured Arcanobacterium sp. TaxID=487520 RepID=UPI0026328942|nr:copper transporter [uncultured Arcanobacterium sp.]
MIDFRYHIVSLVAVFLALATGIILGAGPLQGSIGNALSGEVSSLRKDNTALKAEIGELKKINTQEESAIADMAPELSKGTLIGRSTTVIVFPDTPKEYLEDTKESLEGAGATINGIIEIYPAWTDKSKETMRTQLAASLTPLIAEDMKSSEVNSLLAAALNQLARGGKAAGNNAEIGKILADSKDPLLKISTGCDKPAESIIFLSPDVPDAPAPNSEPTNPDKVAQLDYDAKTYAALVAAIGEKGPTVLGGNANSQHDLVIVVRTNNNKVSTVDSLHRAIGKANIPLALAAAFTDKTVRYGLGDTASYVIGPRIVVPAGILPSAGASQ